MNPAYASRSLWHSFVACLKAVRSLNIAEGAVCCIIGLLIIGTAQQLSRIPRDHRETLARFSVFGRGTRFSRFWERDDVIRIAKVFWIVCGLLWLLGGFSLVLNLSPAIHLP